MQVRPRPWLALVVFSTACASGGEPQSTDSASSPFLTDGFEDSDSTSGGFDSDTTTTTGLPDPTSTTTSTTDPGEFTTTTGPEPTGPGLTTSGPDTTDGTTGEPLDPCPQIRIETPGDVLNVRPTPSTAMAAIATVADGSVHDVVAIVAGESIDGVDTWYQIAGDWPAGYVFANFVQCIPEQEPPDENGFFLPLQCGTTTTVTQGNNGDFSHSGNSAYAFDFSLSTGTPLVAIAKGTVSKLFGDTKPGDPCYNGGGEECKSAANYVILQHEDGTGSVYAHLSAVQVSVGQVVERGGVVGLTGSTGWSTGPHAHVARQEACDFGFCQSIPVSFEDVPDDGVPVTGEMVTSQNCP
ncbi:peptidoglycan DD-metalloendopeptidase family protein [Nannocystis bainbridge]|uniref:Peptidoglycan DD-metalloendopeptidase family protein n=1 Tax=Nannocystis bainbridge TaxID=2995303 RepID=A0ABT5E531_9BACT|nr:peptidoglycan DD-metalloendopeptidase family protein [Nannocystis bainbridge]MDC0720974.1 peptidoglycan DD-metalloendopeptidase family protein [Nannocystis bainbridge]